MSNSLWPLRPLMPHAPPRPHLPPPPPLPQARRAEDSTLRLLALSLRVLWEAATWPLRCAFSCAEAVCRALASFVGLPCRALQAFMREQQILLELHALAVRLETAEWAAAQAQQAGKAQAMRRRQDLLRLALLTQQRHDLMAAVRAALEEVKALRRSKDELAMQLASLREQRKKQALGGGEEEEEEDEEGDVFKPASTRSLKGVSDPISLSLDSFPTHVKIGFQQQSAQRDLREEQELWGAGRDPDVEVEALEQATLSANHYEGLLTGVVHVSFITATASLLLLLSASLFAQGGGRECSESHAAVLQFVQLPLWLILTTSAFTCSHFFFLRKEAWHAHRRPAGAAWPSTSRLDGTLSPQQVSMVPDKCQGLTPNGAWWWKPQYSLWALCLSIVALGVILPGSIKGGFMCYAVAPQHFCVRPSC